MSKPNIIMIHGSWHWGGCFQKVSDRLGGMGYPVSTPDLTSHGYSDVDWESVDSMATYTAPVRALLEAASEPIVLVGHSMGGVSISYLAETMPEKIKSLIYLTAFMSPPGKSANDYIFSYAEDPIAAPLFAVLTPVNDGAGVQLNTSKSDEVRDAFYGDCSDADIRVARNNAVVINSSVPGGYIPKTPPKMSRHYITCTEDHAIPFETQKQMIDESPGAKIHTLTTSHSPFFSAPDKLAELLAEIASD